MKSVSFILMFMGSVLFSAEPTVVIYGGNTNPHLTDLKLWRYGSAYNFQTATIPVPISGVNLTLQISGDQYGYVCLRFSQESPAIVGGFKNGSFALVPQDFAGTEQGFNQVDSNGWPCQISNRAEDGFVYREYRLLNQPFASIIVTLSQ